MRFLTWLVTTAVALAVATFLIDGIRFTGPVHGQEEIKHKLVPLLLVALILGVVTSFVKPILTILSIPFTLEDSGLPPRENHFVEIAVDFNQRKVLY